MLQLKLTRVSPTHHRIEYVRADGTSESAEIESKSFLFHDFVHYAIETEAKLRGGFFGLLSKGHSYAELSGKAPSEHSTEEALVIEQAVGITTGVIKQIATPEEAMLAFKELRNATGKRVPSWYTPVLIERVRERLRHLLGHWNSMRFGETLELEFGK
jgi:hypothetical protein